MDLGSLGVDGELKDILEKEQQKMMFQSQVSKLTDTCWEKCMADSKPSTKLDGRTETCLTNCVERFVDVSLAIQRRFNQMLEKEASMGHN